jgi:L-2-hydroxyglutarate oxidase LhgO
VSRLVYPVPGAHAAGLGIHVTIDLEGRMRLGPDTRYLAPDEASSYAADPAKRAAFAAAVQRYLPAITEADLEPEFAGIRPKLQGPGEPVRDFVIAEESGRGLPGLVNLVGIESPGLTASPGIAREVRRLLTDR